MTTKRRNSSKGKTAEQRAEQAKALQASIAAQVETLRDSEQWRKWLDFVGAFHHYSLGNLLLIQAQCPHASHVAGFRKWQELGRQVRKGETSLKIFGYSTKRVPADEAAKDDRSILEARESENGETYTVRVRYPILSVFDISQTDPIEGAEPIPEPARLLTGDDPQQITEQVAAWLAAQGWSLTREAIPGPMNGYTSMDGTRRVVVDADIEPAAAAKTALHEAAHVILHSEDENEAGETYVTHRGKWETEAESVAYVVAGLLGLDTSGYSIGYIAAWSHGDADLIKETAAHVLTAAHTLADVLQPSPDVEAA